MQHSTIRIFLASVFLLLSKSLSAAEQWHYDEHTSEWLKTHVTYASAESHGENPDSFVILCKDEEIDAYVHTSAYLDDKAADIDYRIDGVSFDEAEWIHAAGSWNGHNGTGDRLVLE